ncbi:MAG: bifunctional glutamate N-acetyltransferase/amino-acid acetyltransferase ArgJ [Bradymonadia bacterium]
MNQFGPVPGFLFSGVHCGIKKSGDLDLALVHVPGGATAAGVYTKNIVVAAPVTLSRSHIDGSETFAIIVNSGNANACTGPQGDRDALEMVTTVANRLGTTTGTVQVCSTGVIGQTLPMSAIKKGIPHVVKALSTDGVSDFSQAIRTTDLYQKAVRDTICINGTTYTVQGVAKGAGMIAPNMATMLAFVFTDAPLSKAQLHALWTRVCDRTFNAMTVDGDTSTNDTALILTSGDADEPLSDEATAQFERCVNNVCNELAHLIVGDGEGATKAVTIKVTGAPNQDAARQVADVIARSPLVKTALHGEDPNWGRIIAAAGRSGIDFNPALIELQFDDERLYADGAWCGEKAESRVHTVMTQPRYTITLNLKCGEASASVLTCDLTAEYVRINADYRS